MTGPNSLLAAIHEEVRLQPYDPRWPGLFAAERDRLRLLAPQLPARLIDIQHIGSTAVPGLAAKPVIDMLAGVESMAAAEALVAPLCANGYTTSAEFNASLNDRKWLMRWADGRRTHHLHIVVHDGAVWAG
ncbi:MAG: GrpB family protein, partial [Polaromonas sp.]|nr:GrpB family protein [Polaromonas sp.]